MVRLRIACISPQVLQQSTNKGLTLPFASALSQGLIYIVLKDAYIRVTPCARIGVESTVVYPGSNFPPCQVLSSSFPRQVLFSSWQLSPGSDFTTFLFVMFCRRWVAVRPHILRHRSFLTVSLSFPDAEPRHRYTCICRNTKHQKGYMCEYMW